MEKESKIYVAGHTGLVGSAIMRLLRKTGYNNIITRTHGELDLLNQHAVNAFFENEQPNYVFIAAAKVGGIGANSAFPADFIYQNMTIGFNIVYASYKTKVNKLLNLGSSCIYPKMTEQPIKEEMLLTGALEPSNDAYALAKISVIKLCSSYNKQYGTNFLSVMPCNLYGPGDSYDLENSHVLPAIIRKFHDAKMSRKNEVILWGDGSPFREFLYSDNLAEAVVYLMEKKNASDLRNASGDFINIGSGRDISIKDLAETIRSIVYEDELIKTNQDPDDVCRIIWDTSKPNGTPRKICDISRLSALYHWTPLGLYDGIKETYKDFLTRF
jgi:GDP-L-fucose synthase